MKFVIILADDRITEAVEKLLDDDNLPGFTEIPSVIGRGSHGKKAGTRAFPGSTNVFFTAVRPAELD
ncbi:MAG: hypothetical protein OEZ54_06590, partial [Gemmatimonadota bacterium]|nr:hypothetical protein [Gemmatimonadota bacterium]